MNLGKILKDVSHKLDLAQRRLRFDIVASALNPRRVPVLDQADFRDLRVIIVGPASTVFDDLRGLDVDGYDIVVRLNNGISLAQESPQALGTRTDVLFHNLNETGERNAGAIPVALLLEHKVRFCVFPHWTFRGSKARLYGKRAELAAHPQITLAVPPAPFCERLREDLAGHKPTTGASAILYFLGCELRELQLHGFTFFQTAYAPGYNEEVKTDEDAADWIAAAKRHDPAREKVLIRERIAQARRRGMTVTLGDHVARHLD